MLAKAQALFGNIAYTPADFVHLFNFASRAPKKSKGGQREAGRGTRSGWGGEVG